MYRHWNILIYMWCGAQKKREGGGGGIKRRKKKKCVKLEHAVLRTFREKQKQANALSIKVLCFSHDMNS